MKIFGRWSILSVKRLISRFHKHLNGSQWKSLFRYDRLKPAASHADQIALTITQLAEEKSAERENLLQQAGYFDHHKHRMGYLELRTDGWVIGSGMVESGGKRFKDRFTKAGMRWSRAGAERLLPFRGAVMCRRFDERWMVAYNSPPD